MFKILFFCFLFLNPIFSRSTEAVSIGKKRLKNGMLLLYSNEHSDDKTVVVSVFLRNGSTLKYMDKTGFTVLSREFLSSRINEIAKKEGFRYKTTESWDYISYIFYLPIEFLKERSDKLWQALFASSEDDEIEFQNFKNKIIHRIELDNRQKFVRFPLISFMTPNRSVYSSGIYGNSDDVASIGKKEFNGFLSCYSNPNNAVLVVSGLKNPSMLADKISKYKPCFMSEKYSNENKTVFNVPQRSVNFVRSWNAGVLVRLGFISSECGSKKSVVYDVISKIIEQDVEINKLCSAVNVYNDCMSSGGVMEIVLSLDPKANADDVVDQVVSRIKRVLTAPSAKVLARSKEEITDSFLRNINDRETLVYILGKAEISAKSYINVPDYLEKINAVKIEDIKSAARTLSPENMCRVFVKMEG
ncbi:MAG: hypothetical protein V1647_05870 [Pseudomonadota bacterium]